MHLGQVVSSLRCDLVSAMTIQTAASIAPPSVNQARLPEPPRVAVDRVSQGEVYCVGQGRERAPATDNFSIKDAAHEKMGALLLVGLKF